MTNRKFGIEIETNASISTVVNLLTSGNVDALEESYGHAVCKFWKVVPDGSVYGGSEIVSPILHGNDGLDQVVKVASILQDAMIKADHVCGLHVHVDASGLTAADIKNIIERYNKYESQIDRWMTPQRRGGNNSYCNSMSYVVNRFASENFDVSRMNPRAFIERWAIDRFHKVNAAAYLRHGTIEFRQHHGTVDANEIVNWIKFCIQFIEDSRITAIEVTPAVHSLESELPENERKNAAEKKYRALAQLLFPFGCTNWSSPVITVEQIMQTLGCARNSVPVLIHAFRTRISQQGNHGFVLRARRGLGYRLYFQDSALLYNIMPELYRGRIIVESTVRYEVREVGLLDNMPAEVQLHLQSRVFA